MPLLELRGLGKAYGGLTVLHAVDLAVDPGAVHAVIGPNGSGKTTLLNCVNGIVTADAGEVWLSGRRIDRLAPHRRTGRGLGRTFQNIRLFPRLSALDNVLVGAHCRTRAGVLSAWTQLPFRLSAEERRARGRAHALLALVGLEARAADRAEGLPLADRRRLEIARALASEPALVMLDEPAAGMNATEKRGMHDLIRRIAADGRAVLLVEHDIGLVFEVSSRVTVLDFGEKIAEGTPAEVRRDARVITAYLGADS